MGNVDNVKQIEKSITTREQLVEYINELPKEKEFFIKVEEIENEQRK